MSGSGIKVSLGPIKKAWRASESREPWVMLKTRSGTPEDFRAALEEVNRQFADGYGDDLPLEATDHTNLVDGYATMLHLPERGDLLEVWANRLAAALQRQGFTGTLTSPKEAAVGWTRGGWPALTLFVRYGPPATVTDPSPRLHLEAATRIATTAAEWARLPGARVFFNQDAVSWELAPDADHARLLAGASQRIDTFTSLQFVDDDHRYALTAEYFPEGNLGIYQVVGDAPGSLKDQLATWQRQLGKLRELLTTNLDLVQCSWIRPARRGPVTWGEVDSAYPLPGYKGVDLWGRADLLADHVLDAHGIQVVTSQHLARANSLADSWYWTITDLGHDRHQIATTQDTHLVNWYQTVPYDLLLNESREAFGDMLITPELIQAHSQPAD